MPKLKRNEPWKPLTVRVSPDADRRLRVAAARMGVPLGQVLDRIIRSTLPPDAVPAPWGIPQKALPEEPVELKAAELRDALTTLGASQAALARELSDMGFEPLDPRAIRDWFKKGKVPPSRWGQVRKALERIRSKSGKGPA